MLFRDSFIKTEESEARALLDAINPHLDFASFDPAKATVLEQPLRFYPGYRFLDIADYTQTPPKQAYVLYNPDHIVVLDWTHASVYELNEKAPVNLNQDTICDYARFFFAFVRGKHGRFHIVESIEEIQWKEDPPPAARKALARLLQPVTLESYDSDGDMYHLSVTFMFKDSLFKSRVHVEGSTGVLSVTDEELQVEDMPVLDETLSH